MGRDSYFVCKSCKERYYLGYGCYGTWHDSAENIEEYDSLSTQHKNLRKNKNMRYCLEMHEGHEFFTYSEDWMHEENGNLYYEKYYENELVVEDIDQYEYMDLWDDK